MSSTIAMMVRFRLRLRNMDNLISVVIRHAKSTLQVCVIDKTRVLHSVVIDKAERMIVDTVKEELILEYRSKGFEAVSLSRLSRS